jgi:hypothetical protein
LVQARASGQAAYAPAGTACAGRTLSATSISSKGEDEVRHRTNLDLRRDERVGERPACRHPGEFREQVIEDLLDLR